MSPNVVKVVTLRWVRWTRHVVRTENTRNAFRIWMENVLERSHLEDQEGYTSSENRFCGCELNRYGSESELIPVRINFESCFQPYLPY